MTSPLPPRLRDTRNLADLVRQQKQNARQLGTGMVGGRWPPAKPLGATAQFGDLEDDTANDETIGFLNTDRMVAPSSGTVTFPLTFEPLDGSEHVMWHPAGYGGLHVPASGWVRDGQTVTIPAFEGLAAGDVFTCEYAYLMGEEPEPIDPSLVGFTTPGTWDSTATTLSYAMPTGTVAGDLLVLTIRGAVAPGGGEVVDGFTCTDHRMSLAFAAAALNGGHAVMESIWLGIADGSGDPILVDLPPGTVDSGKGILASITGANGWGVISAVESGATTPIVGGVAAVAVTWIRGASFTTVTAAPPSGYTNISSTGASYSSTDLSLWYDPDGTSSPAGTFTGEGCCVIALI